MSESTATDGIDYPSIGDYAVIGDCRTVALISRQGSIDWLCLPQFSSPSLFAALLDRTKGGRFAIRPAAAFTTERRYVDDTAVLETVFGTTAGRVRVTDFMPVGAHSADGLTPLRQIVRIIEGLEGSVELDILFQPRPDYARVRPSLARRGWSAWRFEHRGEVFLLRSEAELALAEDGGLLHARPTVRAGETLGLCLAYADRDMLVIPPLGENLDRSRAETVAWWQSWSAQCSFEHRHRPTVMRSILTLKLLTFFQSGAVLAGATTSLPEAVGASRNWDYRYCWLRDASTTLRAFLDLGFPAEGEAFLEWLLHSTRLTRPKLMVLYDVYGRTELRQEELLHLDGYKRSRPVRIGNDAIDQLQLDVYGSVVFGTHYYTDQGRPPDYAERHALRQFGDMVCRIWREPDSGLWEVPGERRHYVHSKLMCWTTLNCLIRMHETGSLKIPIEDYRRERQAIRELIETRGFDEEQQSYVGVLDGKWLDASVLLMARLGFHEPSHPRMMSTYRRIQEQLGRNGLLYRYEPASDGIPSREGTFGTCTFWAVELLALQDRVAEANELFDRMLALGNDVGLFAEEFDAATGEALGNTPQTFTHSGLIAAVFALAEAERRLGVVGSCVTLIDVLIGRLDAVLVWSVIATVLMTVILQGSQSLGFSRLSLPFLVGTFVTSNRGRAVVFGYILYLLGGSAFALLYFLIFTSLGFASWWSGALLGGLHGLVLLVLLTVAPYVHPRIASDYDSPTAGRKLEPPGFLGLNYGRRTPLTTMLGQLVYGAVLGAFLPVG